MLIRTLIIFTILFLPLASLAEVVVDHSNWNPASISVATLDAVRTKKIIFLHKSVGTGMCTALATLASSNPTRYAMSQNDNEETDIVAGTLKEFGYYADNTNPYSKIDDFDDAMRGVGAHPEYGAQANIATMKFCPVDTGYGSGEVPDTDEEAIALYNDYIATIEALQVSYPDVKFVLWTAPISTHGMDRNCVRETFNALVRAYVDTNGGYLFDIADIESHESDDDVCNTGDPDCPDLCDEWAGDMIHPSVSGYERLAYATWKLWADIEEEDSGGSTVVLTGCSVRGGDL